MYLEELIQVISGAISLEPWARLTSNVANFAWRTRDFFCRALEYDAKLNSHQNIKFSVEEKCGFLSIIAHFWCKIAWFIARKVPILLEKNFTFWRIIFASHSLETRVLKKEMHWVKAISELLFYMPFFPPFCQLELAFALGLLGSCCCCCVAWR